MAHRGFTKYTDRASGQAQHEMQSNTGWRSGHRRRRWPGLQPALVRWIPLADSPLSQRPPLIKCQLLPINLTWAIKCETHTIGIASNSLALIQIGGWSNECAVSLQLLIPPTPFTASIHLSEIARLRYIYHIIGPFKSRLVRGTYGTLLIIA